MNNYKNGIDVSHWQGTIDWQKVIQDKQHIEFAFVKATEGETYQDPKFQENWQGMNENGLKSGAYHYFRAAENPQKQVDNIVGVLKEVDFDKEKHRVVIDIEPYKKGEVKASSDLAADNLWQVITGIEAQLGGTPIIYTNNSFWNNEINYGKYPFHEKCPLWVANWNVETPKIPGSWKEWKIWQHSCKGNVEGIKGDVDLDRMHLDEVTVMPLSSSPVEDLIAL